MKRLFLIAVPLMLLEACAAPRVKRGHDTVQLVYHSDTRGYYRPCG